jgi:hypothetical protein
MCDSKSTTTRACLRTRHLFAGNPVHEESVKELLLVGCGRLGEQRGLGQLLSDQLVFCAYVGGPRCQLELFTTAHARTTAHAHACGVVIGSDCVLSPKSKSCFSRSVCGTSLLTGAA